MNDADTGAAQDIQACTKIVAKTKLHLCGSSGTKSKIRNAKARGVGVRSWLFEESVSW